MSKTVNKSGIQPLEYKVLILPDDIEQTTTGGIIVPASLHEQHEWAQVRGTLVAMGSLAFTHRMEEPLPDKPPVGAKVYFAKYQGILVPGSDGKEYRLCNDKDVAAVVI